MIRIFCDLDGVLSRFSDAAIKLHIELGNCEEGYVPNSWNYYEDWNISANQFWTPIHESPRFWHDLQPFEYFDELVSLIEDYDGNFKILTSPTNQENCYAGKCYWIKKHFDFNPNNRAIIHSDKSALVKDEDCVLIDDAEHNCEQWEAAGGKAILFPDECNKNYPFADKVAYVKKELAKMYGEM